MNCDAVVNWLPEGVSWVEHQLVNAEEDRLGGSTFHGNPEFSVAIVNSNDYLIVALSGNSNPVSNG